MKTISVSLILTGLLLPAVCLAQPKEALGIPTSDKADPRQGKSFEETWEAMDKDKDGSLSLVEFSSLSRIQRVPVEKRDKIFTRLDKNTDGKLNREELEELANQGDGLQMKRLWALDVDGSGSVSFEEFKNGPVSQKLPLEKQEEMFKRLDSNRDGLITKNDRPIERPRGGAPSSVPNRPELNLDANKDGALSFEEFRQGPRMKKLGEDQQEASFEALDSNGDLKITVEDFSAPMP